MYTEQRLYMTHYETGAIFKHFKIRNHFQKNYISFYTFFLQDHSMFCLQIAVLVLFGLKMLCCRLRREAAKKTVEKKCFSLMARPFTPPPLLMARPLREELFLRLP